MKRTVLAVLLLALVLTACGKSRTTAAGSTSTTAVGSAGGSTTTTVKGATTTAKGATTPTTAGGGSTTTAPGGATTTTVKKATTTTTIPVTTRIHATCAHPTDSQGFDLNGPVDSTVGYDTTYSDGTNGMTTRYGSGVGTGKTDGTGSYKVSWTLAPNVPAGEATINLAVVNGGSATRAALRFMIKPIGQAC